MKRLPSRSAPFRDLFEQSIEIARRLWIPVILGAITLFSTFIVCSLLTILVLGFLGPVDFQNPIEAGNVRDILLVLVVLLFVIIVTFLLWASSTYYQVLAVERQRRMRDALRRVPSAMVPLAYCGVWVFLRTWSWIPLILILPALLLVGSNPFAIIGVLVLGVTGIIACIACFTPRVALASVIVIQERVTPLQSVRLSEQRTHGYFWKVLGNVLFLSLILWILSFGMQTLLGELLDTFLNILGGNAMFIFKIASIAFLLFLGLLACMIHALLQFVPLVFMAQLHATLKDNPR